MPSYSEHMLILYTMFSYFNILSNIIVCQCHPSSQSVKLNNTMMLYQISSITRCHNKTMYTQCMTSLHLYIYQYVRVSCYVIRCCLIRPISYHITIVTLVASIIISYHITIVYDIACNMMQCVT